SDLIGFECPSFSSAGLPEAEKLFRLLFSAARGCAGCRRSYKNLPRSPLYGLLSVCSLRRDRMVRAPANGSIHYGIPQALATSLQWKIGFYGYPYTRKL